MEVRVAPGETIESAFAASRKPPRRRAFLAEARKHEHYEKPSVRRKKKSAAAASAAPDERPCEAPRCGASSSTTVSLEQSNSRMALKDQLSSDLKEAMKARDQVRLDTLRSVLSAFSYRRIEVGRELGDDDQVEVVRKQVKQRNDSIAEFAKAGRTELVEKETRERDILSAYLPAQKSADEIREAVRRAMAADSPIGRNQGALMKAVLPGLRDRPTAPSSARSSSRNWPPPASAPRRNFRGGRRVATGDMKWARMVLFGAAVLLGGRRA